MVDAVDGLGGGALGDVDDALLDLRRRHSRVVPEQIDFRDVHAGKDIFRHREECHQTEQHHYRGHRDDGDRASGRSLKNA